MNVVAPVTAEVDFSRTMFLVADDKPFFRDLAHTALSRCRARDVKYATCVDTAVEVLKRYGQHIGGIVCDWDMAPVGGLELLRRVRAGKLQRTPRDACVVILTPRPDTAAVKAALQLDVNGFVVAPLSIEKLIKTLGQAMHRTWSLRDAAHYLAVPQVAVPQAAPDGKSRRDPTAHWHRDDVQAAAAAGRTAPKRDLINVRMVPLCEARAGHVLARDLKDRDGHLLLKTGTPLSPALLERIDAVAHGDAEAYHVWIGDRPA